MRFSVHFLILLLLQIVCTEHLYSVEYDDFDLKNDILIINDENAREVKRITKTTTAIVLFSTEEIRYDCQGCEELEQTLSSIQQSYYTLPQSKKKPILFAIARPEMGRVFFDEAKVQWVPHAQILLPKSKESKKTVISFTKNGVLNSNSFLKWINSSLDLDLRVPIPDDYELSILVFVTGVIILFSFLFPFGYNMLDYLKRRSSYLYVCLIIVFLCLACLPYILINLPPSYQKALNRKGVLIYRFFSGREDKYALEGFIIVFWVLIVFGCVYGLLFGLEHISNSFITSFVVALLLSTMVVALLQLKENFEFAMPFLGRMISQTMEIMRSVMPKKKTRTLGEWKKYFASLGKMAKQCFHFLVCYMEFDFSSDSSNRPRKGPPKRFLMRNAPTTEVNKAPELKSEDKKGENPIHRRFVPSHPCRDGSVVYTAESAVQKLEEVIPVFATQKGIIDTATKWKDKVDAFQLIHDYVKENVNSLSSYSEALVLYSLSYTNQCNASNINILRSGLDFLKTICERYSIGPRISSTLVPCFLNKIHEKSLYSTISDILLTICEKVGPNTVMSSMMSIMSTSKKAIQQKAVLQWFLQVVLDFGACHINIKDLINYLQTPQALQSTSPDVKKGALSILSELYKQLGSSVLELVDLFELPELQLKHIREELNSIQYDPSYAGIYQSLTKVDDSNSVIEKGKPEVSSTFLLSSLIDPVDLTNEITPLLHDLRNTKDKDSWKIRLEAVNKVIELFEKKQAVLNTPVVGELLIELKNRFGETNLNIRTKMIQAVGIVVSKLTQGVSSSTNAVVTELLKYTGDTKVTVAEATLTTLTQWVTREGKTDVVVLGSVMPLIPIAFKSAKGRQRILEWLRDNVGQCEGRVLLPIIHGVLDGILDKTKETRNAASDILEVLLDKCGVEAVMKETANRRPIDTSQLVSIIKALAGTLEEEIPPPVIEEKPEPAPKKDSSTLQQRQQALSKRPGARVLTKPKLGPDGKPIPKYNAKSTIPKPLPRKTNETKRSFYMTSRIPAAVMGPIEPIEPMEPIEPIEPIEPMTMESVEPNELDGLQSGEIQPTEENPLAETIDVFRIPPVPFPEEESLYKENPPPDLSIQPSQLYLQPSTQLETPMAVSLGIPLNKEELLFDEEVEEENGVIGNESVFLSTFLLHVRNLHYGTEELCCHDMNFIVDSCFPREGGIKDLLSPTDIQSLSAGVATWMIPLSVYAWQGEASSSFKQAFFDLCISCCYPNSPLFNVTSLSTDCLSVMIINMITELFSSSSKIVNYAFSLLVDHAPVISLLWSFIHVGNAMKRHLNNSLFVEVLEKAINHLRKRLNQDASISLDDSKEVDNLLMACKGVFPVSLVTQIELCVMMLPKKNDRSDDVSVQLPPSVQRAVENRLRNKNEPYTIDIDERMTSIRQRMGQLQLTGKV